MKTTWNYRIIEDKGVFNIYEVYYSGKKPHSWSKEPIYAQGETFNELVEDFSAMQNAFSAPILKIKGNKLL